MEIEEIDPLELKEKADEIHQRKTEQEEYHQEHRLNMRVALTIALLATCMGICKVKNDGIILNMQQAQANKLDDWAWYQTRHVRVEIAHATAIQMQLSAKTFPKMKKDYEQQVDTYNKLALEQESKMKDLQKQALEEQKKYDEYHERNDQFDLAEAGMTIAIAILAITSLTRMGWLYWLSMIPGGFGVIMGLAGLFNWPIRPEWLMKIMAK
jgi:hypothetical protein